LIFVDTSAFYALEVEGDVNHAAARRFLEEIKGGKYGVMVTTDYVLDEVLTLLRLRHGVDAALRFLEKVRRSRSIKVVWVDESVFEQALRYFKLDEGRRWSFTDCTSFAVMEMLGIRQVFAFDEDFELAGFVRLP